MANAKRMGGLGKGLQALIPDMPAPAQGAETADRLIPIREIRANPYQPRLVFDSEKLGELSASIKTHGVIQPVLVREVGGGYELIAGERRMRAAKEAGLEEIPAVIRALTDHEAIEISIIENIQRQDLDPVEEAKAYKRLAEEFGQTQEQIAGTVSKSRSYIANSIRLLHLPDPILAYLAAGTLTIGHVRPLLALDKKEATLLANRMVESQATVREAEQWTKETAQTTAGAVRKRPVAALPAALKEIQRLIRESVNTKVEITAGKKGGKVIIDYYTQDDLERILELFTGYKEV